MNAVMEQPGGALKGGIWMCVLSVLLFWLPGVGGFIAGLVGGRVAGGLSNALLAWLLSSVLVGALLAIFGTLLTGFVLIGVIAGLGGTLWALIDSGGRLLGALVGGLIS